MQNKKAIVSVGYNKYVMDTEKAVMFLDLLASAEVYEFKYRSKEKGTSTYHVYDQEVGVEHTFTIMPDAFYRMCKLAGKPIKD